MALVDFVEPSEARAAYKGLAYRSYKHVPLYLEWAPLGIMSKPQAGSNSSSSSSSNSSSSGSGKGGDEDEKMKKSKDPSSAAHDSAKPSSSAKSKGVGDEDDGDGVYSTLFVKNLNFVTDEAGLTDHAHRYYSI